MVYGEGSGGKTIEIEDSQLSCRLFCRGTLSLARHQLDDTPRISAA